MKKTTSPDHRRRHTDRARAAGAGRARSKSQCAISPNQPRDRTEQFGDNTRDDLPQFNDGGQDESPPQQRS
jgi:hypothetical protein